MFHMTAQPVRPGKTPPADAGEPTYGFGRQSRGSRKGLGGDPPNAPVERQKPRSTTTDQIAEMESEGQGQK